LHCPTDLFFSPTSIPVPAPPPPAARRRVARAGGACGAGIGARARRRHRLLFAPRRRPQPGKCSRLRPCPRIRAPPHPCAQSKNYSVKHPHPPPPPTPIDARCCFICAGRGWCWPPAAFRSSRSTGCERSSRSTTVASGTGKGRNRPRRRLLDPHCLLQAVLSHIHTHTPTSETPISLFTTCLPPCLLLLLVFFCPKFAHAVLYPRVRFAARAFVQVPPCGPRILGGPLRPAGTCLRPTAALPRAAPPCERVNQHCRRQLGSGSPTSQHRKRVTEPLLLHACHMLATESFQVDVLQFFTLFFSSWMCMFSCVQGQRDADGQVYARDDREQLQAEDGQGHDLGVMHVRSCSTPVLSRH